MNYTGEEYSVILRREPVAVAVQTLNDSTKQSNVGGAHIELRTPRERISVGSYADPVKSAFT